MNKKLFPICFLVCLFSIFTSCNNKTPDIEKLLLTGQGQAFHITYDANGGSGTMKNQFMAPGHSEELKQNEYTAPNRYYFGYWNTEPDGTGAIYYEDDKLTMGSKNVTLYAIWLPTDTFVIQYYNLNGVSNPNPATYTVADTIQLTAPVRNGYTFNGWYTDSSFYEQYLTSGWQRDTIDGTQKLYARWTPITYSIYYDENNGTMPASYTTSYTIESSNITLPTPTRTGYTFKGWLEQDATDAVYTLTTGSYGTKSYVAQWQINTYKVYYYSNDGNGNVEEKEYEYNASFEISTNLFTARNGYSFIGWGTKTNSTAASYTPSQQMTMPANDIYLYAIWNTITYSITYNANNGTMPASYATTFTIESDDITLPTPTRTGYTFKGWLELNSTSAVYTLATGSYGAKSYTAQWQINTYTVYYYSNDGNNGITTYNVDYGSSFTIKANMYSVPVGYTFGGWGSSSTSTTAAYSVNQSVTMGSQNISLYAIWTEKPAHSITYNNTLGASNSNPSTFREKNDVTLSNLSITNGTFLGWYDSSSSTANKVTGWTKGTKTADVTLYAKWSTPTSINTKGANGTFSYIMGNASLKYTITVSVGTWSSSLVYYSGDTPGTLNIDGVPSTYLKNGTVFTVTITATNASYGTYKGTSSATLNNSSLKLTIPSTLTKQ